MKVGIKIINDNVILNTINPTKDFEILEIDDKYSDCQPLDFCLETLKFSIEKYNDRKQKEIDIIRIEELTNWFNNYFDKQLKQSLWQDDFKPSYDTFFKREYKDINDLKTQAQVVRNQIKELRGK